MNFSVSTERCCILSSAKARGEEACGARVDWGLLSGKEFCLKTTRLAPCLLPALSSQTLGRAVLCSVRDLLQQSRSRGCNSRSGWSGSGRPHSQGLLWHNQVCLLQTQTNLKHQTLFHALSSWRLTARGAVSPVVAGIVPSFCEASSVRTPTASTCTRWARAKTGARRASRRQDRDAAAASAEVSSRALRPRSGFAASLVCSFTREAMITAKHQFLDLTIPSNPDRRTAPQTQGFGALPPPDRTVSLPADSLPETLALAEENVSSGILEPTPASCCVSTGRGSQ